MQNMKHGQGSGAHHFHESRPNVLVQSDRSERALDNVSDPARIKASDKI